MDRKRTNSSSYESRKTRRTDVETESNEDINTFRMLLGLRISEIGLEAALSEVYHIMDVVKGKH